MFLVKVEYTLPIEIKSIYFRDDVDKGEEHYENALLAIHPRARVERITRNVEPIDTGK